MVLQIAAAKEPNLDQLKKAIRVVDIDTKEKDDVMACTLDKWQVHCMKPLSLPAVCLDCSLVGM